jgi:hypothetical protein
VRPETAAFLDTAREQLGRAGTMLGVGLAEDAGRAAYPYSCGCTSMSRRPQQQA